MTREEAIKSALKYLVHKQQEQGSWGYADNDNINKVPWDEALEWIDQQPCGDLISRQAVIDTIETDCSWDMFNEWGSRTPTGERIINAIKSVPSVEQESCGDCISRQAAIDEIEWEEEYGRIDTSKAIDCLKKLPSVEPEKCGDCVNRQAVLDLAKSGKLVSNGNYKSVCDAINGLPSVEPERKKGKWIDEGQYADGYSSHAYRCSECGGHIIECRPDDFCKFCGADMREVAGE